MQRIPVLVKCLGLALCVPLVAYANPQQAGQSDCKSLINHSGFAEFVVPSEGGTQKLPIEISPSATWRVRNTEYVNWIEILDGGAGTGPGTLTIQLEANTGRACRVGVLTIVGVQMFFESPFRVGSPIRILQRGTEAAGAEEPPKSSPTCIIYLAPFSSNDPLGSGKPDNKPYIKKKK